MSEKKKQEYTTGGLKNRQDVENALASAEYRPSQEVTDAASNLKQWQANRPGDYESAYQGRIDGLMEDLLDRKEFSYSYGADPLYRQYAQLYTQNAQNASADAAAQAAALTGGYGSSYAASAARQAYQQQIGALSEAIPTLYRLALDTYQSGGDALVEQIDQLNGQEQNAQQRYERELADYYTQLEQKGNAYNTAYTQDYGRYQDYLGQLDSLYGYYAAQEQQEAARRQQGFNNVMTVLGLLGDAAQLAITGTTGLGSMAGSLLNTGYNIYAGNRAYEAERADTAWKQKMQEQLRQDELAQQQYKNEQAQQEYQDKLRQQQVSNALAAERLDLSKSQWAAKQEKASRTAEKASADAAAKRGSLTGDTGLKVGKSGVSSGGIIEREVLLPQRGRIMDANEEILTSNMQSSELIADGYHLNDPKTISWALAYSKAVHSPFWEKAATDKEKEKLVSGFRSKILGQAASKKDGSKEHNLAKILLEEPEDGPEGVDMARKKLEELYEPEMVKEYVQAHLEYAAKVIAPFLPDMSVQDIINTVEKDGAIPKKRIVIAKNLSEEKAELLRQAIQNARVQGFRFETSSKRVYSVPECMVHILGYIAQTKDSGPRPVALSGLEKQLDDQLLGHNGIREYRKDSRGRIIPSADSRFKDAVDGLNVRLTVNMEYQTIMEEELDAAISLYTDQTHKPRGCIIVVEPKTGSILAMASRPHYNLNTREGLQEGAYHFAVQSLYEPGSTFKIVSVTSAVDSGKATFDTMINCTPYPVPGSRPVTDAPRSYGGLTVAGVLKKSSNPGAFRIALKSGWPTYKKYFDLYGFSSKTGIDLPGETNSQCQDGSNFVNFSRISFGYSLMVSPLQVAMAYAAIANDGVRMRPRLVDGIYVDDKNFQPSPPVEVCRVMSVKTARDLRNALFHVTDLDGTAKRARIEGYNVGGKTGTAHKVKPTGGYFENRYTVSFVGMLPVEDPAFVCLVVIDDPTSKHCHPGGGTVCAPVFQKLATRLAAAMNIPKNSPSAEANKKASRAQASSTPSKPPRR